MNDNFDWNEFRKYMKSDDYVKNIKKCDQSEEFKSAMKKLNKNVRKQKSSSFVNFIKTNIFNIFSLLISTAALLIAILSYLK